MTDLKLETGEGILLQTDDAGLYDGNQETDIDELYLTNKNLIYVHEKSTGIFKSETVVDKIPLSSIAVINGIVQIERVDDDDYGKCLQIIFTGGKRELLELMDSPKKQYPVWKSAIADAVIRLNEGTSIPRVGAISVNAATKEDKSEKALGGAAVFAGFKGVADDIKQTFSEVSRVSTSTNNGAVDASADNTIVSEEPMVGQKKYKFCTNCGEKLIAGSKFCNACGTPTGNVKTKREEFPPVRNENIIVPPPVKEDSKVGDALKTEQERSAYSERKQEYSGKIYKCPSCGEVLETFVVVCPTCGYELRGVSTSDSVSEFAEKINRAQTDTQRVNIIRNYPIPNAKEDIIEFMIIASSNISGESDKRIFEAWVAKFEQAYQKSKITLKNDPSFTQIQEIYDKTEKAITKGKIVHTTNVAGNLITRFFKYMRNPFVALLVIWIGICMISAIVRKSYIFIIIAAVAFIGYLIYKKVSNNKNDE